MKNFLSFTILLTFFFFSSSAQNHDYFWMMGYGSNTTDSSYGGTIIDFNVSPPSIEYKFLDINFDATVNSFCDSAGNLLYYTNGLEIYNMDHELMENGDSLNPGQIADWFQDFGYPLIQGAISLPYPKHPNEYILLHSKELVDSVFTITLSLLYSKIDLNENNGLGIVKEKNMEVLAPPLLSTTVTKHANGRDWWILTPEEGSKKYFLLLLDSNGISFEKEIIIEDQPYVNTNTGQVNFCPDGSLYAHFDNKHALNIFDFDRCVGELSNYRYVTFDEPVQPGAGAVFSPNSRFLYFTSNIHIYQLDLWENDLQNAIDTVAIYDGHQSPFGSTFFFGQLGPDGKIYLNCTNGENVLHVIEKPDLKGLACEVKQHGVQLPTYNAFSLPHFPNYRLGALEGSPCDTLEEMNTSIYEKRDDQKQKISIYPNPANSAIYLKKEANTDAHVKQVSLFNALGHRVKFWKSVEEGQALAVADLVPGIYFYVIHSEEGVLGKGKLVIGKER